jgi:predicted AAA+ superfamily ATPase
MDVSKKGVLSSCKPRKEVLEGELNDAMFAAEFRYLINGTAQPVYKDPKLFFQNTEPTDNLKDICHFIFRSLNDKKEGGQLIRLSTGYGGGKSHTLMALWHLAHKVSDPKFKNELLPASNYPKRVKVIAIDAADAGIPIFTTHDKIKIHSLQGEIFWQLGGSAGLKNLGPADNHESCPDERLLSENLGTGPLLILLDELVIYMASLSTTGQGNFLNFIGKLISAVKMRPETVLVITDPGSQHAYANVTQILSGKIGSAALSLDDIFGRKMSDYDPIGKSAAKVIARRLFEKIDRGAAKTAAEQYHNLYARIMEQNSKLLPENVVSEDIKKNIEECYPFHPRLIETAKERLGPLPEFQRSRGVLRLFARIVRDIWDQKVDLDLITAGDINWGSDRIRSDLLQRLRREQFAAAVDAVKIRTARELGRLIKSLRPDIELTDLQNDSRFISEGALTPKINDALQRLGNQFVLTEYLKWEIKEFVGSLTPNEIRSRQSGSSLDAALNDYRWKIQDNAVDVLK